MSPHHSSIGNKTNTAGIMFHSRLIKALAAGTPLWCCVRAELVSLCLGAGSHGHISPVQLCWQRILSFWRHFQTLKVVGTNHCVRHCHSLRICDRRSFGSRFPEFQERGSGQSGPANADAHVLVTRRHGRSGIESTEGLLHRQARNFAVPKLLQRAHGMSFGAISVCSLQKPAA